MPTERTPLREGISVPPYVFLTNSHRSYKNKIRRFQCCICAGILAVFLTALVITVSYTVNEDIEDENVTSTTPTSSSTSESPINDAALTTLLTLEWPLKDKPYESWSDVPNDTEIETAISEGRKNLEKKEIFEEKVPTLLMSSPSFRHQMATKTVPKARELSKTGHIMEGATKYLAKSRLNDKKSIGRSPVLNMEWLPEDLCKEDVPNTCTKSPYRSSDGRCNNWNHPRTWGVAMRPFRRMLPPDYADGISAPRKGASGARLPSARDVSVTVHRPFYRDDPHFTVMLAVWGQFIDHDITATALSQGKGGSAISCCIGYYQAGLTSHPECYTVPLEYPDPYYNQYNVTCMEFVRASPAPSCSFGPREQLNQATSFLDGSVIYGTTDSLMTQLRTNVGGELKMLVTPEGLELLPVSTDESDGCNQEEELAKGRYCFLSGDPRSNENIHLTTMHLLFARQHNLIVRKLAVINPHWDDEKLFQEGRKIVSAQLQHITYNEFLSIILGPNLMEKVKMHPRESGYYDTYDPTLDASIANSFAASAFRFGHTLLPGLVRVIAGDNDSPEYIEMHKMLFNPFQLYDKGFLEKAVRGALDTPTEKMDTYFNPEFTERLFQRKSSIGQPKGMCGLDLVALNVQRGRDHGLPGYAAWREHCGLGRPKSFQDLDKDMDPDSFVRILQIYKSVEDIDMYTGALAEKPLKGSLVGPTVTCVLTDQFLRLQRGDRFWYETPEEPQAFTPEQLKSIRETTLAKVICDTSGMETLQPYVMKRVTPENQRTSCADLPSLDFNAWKEPSKVPVSSDVGKIWLIKSSAPTAPKVTRIRGVAVGGAITLDGTSVWGGSFPVKIPVPPFDAVADLTEVDSIPYPPVYAHGILWSGNIKTDLDKASIKGAFSLPRYIHSDGSPIIKWYNGEFSLLIDILWNSTGQSITSFEGNYSTPLYFREKREYLYLKNKSIDNILRDPSSSSSPSIDVNNNVAPLILLGAFSDEGNYFLWSGNVTLSLSSTPQSTKEPEYLLKLAYTPKSYVKKFKIGGTAKSGSIRAQGSTVWNGQFPLSIPVDPLDTVANSEDTTDNSEIVIGHGISWKGSVVSTKTNSATISGEFSLPIFVHSNGISPFSVHWYNGDLSVDCDFEWNSGSDNVVTLNGEYKLNVHFSDRWQYHYLKNATSQNLLINSKIGYAGSPKQSLDGLQGSIILLGTYSNDGASFIWSGNFTLILPEVISVKSPSNGGVIPGNIKMKSASASKVRIPLRLIGGEVNIKSGNLWYNDLPIAIPVNSFDSVAEPDSEPTDRPIVYGHGILWNGSASKIDENYINLQGKFSFPKFIHSNGITNNVSLSWINGNFKLQFQSNVSVSVDGEFSSSVYFAQRHDYETLQDGSLFRLRTLDEAGIGKTATPEVLTGDPADFLTMPLILFGVYSVDRSEFLWSGECILFTPSVKTPNIILKASPPSSNNDENIRVGGIVSSFEIFVEDRPLLGFNKPPISLSTDILKSVYSPLLNENEPPLFAQGILWSGTIMSSLDSTALLVTGKFSLPKATNTSLLWYNGNFSININGLWNATKLNVTGSFSSPIYFQNKRNVTPSFSDVSQYDENSLEVSKSPSVSADVSSSLPILLSGSLSLDKSVFYWSGGISLILPSKTNLLKEASSDFTNSRLSLSAFVDGGSITLSGSTIWLGNRIPLNIPLRLFPSAVSPLDESINTSPKDGQGLFWKGFMSSDAPGSMKIWGAYSLPQLKLENKTDWYNGNFAFELKLYGESSLLVNVNGTYITKLYLHEKLEPDTALTEVWNISATTAVPTENPSVMSNGIIHFAPLILWGNYSPDKSIFIWSGNVTLIVGNNTFGNI